MGDFIEEEDGAVGAQFGVADGPVVFTAGNAQRGTLRFEVAVDGFKERG